MDDDLLRKALVLLEREGKNTTNVLSWKAYDDRVVIVVEAGHKYVVPRQQIIALETAEKARTKTDSRSERKRR